MSSREDEHKVPEEPAKVYITLPKKVQRRSELRDEAAVKILGKLSALLANPRENLLPENLRDLEPTGPCAKQIDRVLKCAKKASNIKQCEAFIKALRKCNRHNRNYPSPYKYGGGRSYYGRNHRTPAYRPPTYVTPPPQQRSVFRDAAAVAGGVTVGTTMGHVAGSAITGLFGGRGGGGGGYNERRYEDMPRDHVPGSQPSGPCAYEIGQFLNCASVTQNLQECAPFSEALRECKRRHGIP